MTSYAPNYTSRYRAHYNVNGIDHTIQMRKAIGATPAATALLAGTAHDIFNALADRLCSDFVWLSAEQADEDSDIFYPSTVPVAVTGLVPPGDYTPFQKVTHTRFGGKAFGSRASLEMYGIFWQYANNDADTENVGYDGKVTAVEEAGIGTVASLLNSQAFANSGGPTLWYPRATIKVNDFWLKQVRSGGIT
jgi:hypothetical protein